MKLSDAIAQYGEKKKEENAKQAAAAESVVQDLAKKNSTARSSSKRLAQKAARARAFSAQLLLLCGFLLMAVCIFFGDLVGRTVTAILVAVGIAAGLATVFCGRVHKRTVQCVARWILAGAAGILAVIVYAEQLEVPYILMMTVLLVANLLYDVIAQLPFLLWDRWSWIVPLIGAIASIVSLGVCTLILVY